MGGTDMQSPSYDQGQTACHKETSNRRKMPRALLQALIWTMKTHCHSLLFLPFTNFPAPMSTTLSTFLLFFFQSMWNRFWWERSDFTVRRVCKINLQMLREGLATAGSAQSLGACTDFMGGTPHPEACTGVALSSSVIVRYSWQQATRICKLFWIPLNLEDNRFKWHWVLRGKEGDRVT